jgi:hypothetical protein
MYYGLEWTPVLEGCLMLLLRSAMHRFVDGFLADTEVARDAEAISSYTGPFVGGGTLAGNWRFVQSLHTTTCFLGHGKKPSARFGPIDESITYTYLLTHLYYIPERLILLSATSIGEASITDAQVNPHVTLLINRWPAKDSNAVLKAGLYDGEGVVKRPINVNQQRVNCYVMKLEPALLVTGNHIGFDK